MDIKNNKLLTSLFINNCNNTNPPNPPNNPRIATNFGTINHKKKQRKDLTHTIDRCTLFV